MRDDIVQVDTREYLGVKGEIYIKIGLDNSYKK